MKRLSILLIAFISTILISAPKTKKLDQNPDIKYVTGKWYLFSNQDIGDITSIYDFNSNGSLSVYQDFTSKQDKTINLWEFEKNQTNPELISIIIRGDISKIRIYRDKTNIENMLPEEYSEYSEYKDKFNILLIDDEETPICATKDKDFALTLLQKTHPASYAWKMTNKDSIPDLEKFSLSEHSKSYQDELKAAIEKNIDKEVTYILNNKFKEFSKHFNRRVIENDKLQDYTIIDIIKLLPFEEIMDMEFDCELLTIENNPFIPGAFNILLPDITPSTYTTIPRDHLGYHLLTLVPYQDKAIIIGKTYLTNYSIFHSDDNIGVFPRKNYELDYEQFEQDAKIFFGHCNKRRIKNSKIQKEIAIVSCKEAVFREKPDINSPIIESDTYRFASPFIIIGKSDRKSKINGIEEYWYQCRSNRGWIFGGDILRTKFEPFIKNFKTETIYSKNIVGGGNSFLYQFSPIVIGDIFIAYIYHNDYPELYIESHINGENSINREDIPENGLIIGKFSEEKGFYKFSNVLKIAGYSNNGQWIEDPSKFSETYGTFINFNLTIAPYFDQEGLYFITSNEKSINSNSNQLPYSRQYYRDLRDNQTYKGQFWEEFRSYGKCHISDFMILNWLNEPSRLYIREK